jgi:hypothetical protein
MRNSLLKFLTGTKRPFAKGPLLDLCSQITYISGFQKVAFHLCAIAANIHPQPALIPIPISVTVPNRLARTNKHW